MEKKHLCVTCLYDFAVCPGKNVTFGIDIDQTLRGADADMVIECDSYEQTLNSPNIPAVKK